MQKLEEVLDQRGSTHGDFRDQFAMSQSLKSVFASMCQNVQLTLVQKEVLEMLALKVSRIACGDHMEPDHWLDISGYAKLAATEASEARFADEARKPPSFITPDTLDAAALAGIIERRAKMGHPPMRIVQQLLEEFNISPKPGRKSNPAPLSTDAFKLDQRDSGDETDHSADATAYSTWDDELEDRSNRLFVKS